MKIKNPKKKFILKPNNKMILRLSIEKLMKMIVSNLKITNLMVRSMMESFSSIEKEDEHKIHM